MKRPLIKAIFVGFVALAVSGWGNILAVSLCPHMGFAAVQKGDESRNAMPAGHSCHSMARKTPASSSKVSASLPAKSSLASSISSEIPGMPCSMGGQSGSILAANGEGLTLRPAVQHETPSAAVPAIHLWPSCQTIVYRQGAPPPGRTRSHLTFSIIQV